MKVAFMLQNYANRLFNVRAGEWQLVLLLYAMIGIFNIGWIWAITFLEAAFYHQVGISFLPSFLLVKGVMAVLVAAIYAGFADRVSNRRLLLAILAVGIVGIVIGLLLLGFGLTQLAIPLLYLLAFIPFDEVLSNHWLVYINGFYDTRSIKRLLPFINTSFTIASIIAGLTVPLIGSVISSFGVICIWLCTTLAIPLIVQLIAGIRPDSQPTETVLNQAQQSSSPSGNDIQAYISNIREGARFVLQSSFLRWLLISTLALSGLMTFLQYQTGYVLLAQLGTQQAIASFLGIVTGVSNILVLPFQLFFLSRIIGKIGLGNTHLIYPTTSLLSSGALLLAPTLLSAMLAYLNRTTIYYSVGIMTDGLLFNAVPLSHKGRARIFISGFVAPLGFIAAALLLVFLQAFSLSWLAPLLLIASAITFMVSAFIIRRQYGNALVEMLAKDDFSFLLAADAGKLSAADPTTLQDLKRRIEASTSPDTTIFLIRMLGEISDKEMVAAVEKLLPTSTEATVRATLLDTLTATQIRSDSVLKLYVDSLADLNAQVRLAALNGIEHFFDSDYERYIAHTAALLNDPDIYIRVRVLPAYLQRSDTASYEVGLQLLQSLLASEESEQRALAVHAIGRSRNPEFLPLLLEYYRDPSDALRLELGLALEILTLNDMQAATSTAFLDRIHYLASDPIERVRQAALQSAVRLSTPTALPLLLTALIDPSTHVRTSAVMLLVQIGEPAVPALLKALETGHAGQRSMVAAVLSRINPVQFDGLIRTSIYHNLVSIYRNESYLHSLADIGDYPALPVLTATLNEHTSQLLKDIFYLLESVHAPESVQIIYHSLQSSDALMRANATEALEALTTPQTAQLVSALFDPELSIADKLQIAKHTWMISPTHAIATLQSMLTEYDSSWLRTIVITLLGEIGATHTQQPGVAEHTMRPAQQTTSDSSATIALHDIEKLLDTMRNDQSADVQMALSRVAQLLHLPALISDLAEPANQQQFTTVERVMFLKDILFFQNFSIEQLRALASICVERHYNQQAAIFQKGEQGDTLYIIVRGQVAIEQEKRRGVHVRTATLAGGSYFGEMQLFNQGIHNDSARALDNTLILQLASEPVIALARQSPDISLSLIHVLSQHLYEANNRISELTRTRPRELLRLFDQF